MSESLIEVSAKYDWQLKGEVSHLFSLHFSTESSYLDSLIHYFQSHTIRSFLFIMSAVKSLIEKFSGPSNPEDSSFNKNKQSNNFGTSTIILTARAVNFH